MLIKKPGDVLSSEITPEAVYHDRRRFLRNTAAFSALLASGCAKAKESDGIKPTGGKLDYQAAVVDAQSGFHTSEKLTPYEHVASYNNFYEFGMDKSDPARYAHSLKTKPWTVRIDGEVNKPGDYHMEDIRKWFPLEERIYRLRCVEAWSMVIPWVGFPLADLIKRVEPTSKAKYVAFETLHAPKQMRGQRSFTTTIKWPYKEGLRLDEAMHPLSLMAVGLYGHELPNQNGAPLRLVVPWKYGFKSIKSIVRISLTNEEPKTSWNISAPREYGFYANVNPAVDHPRWSQKYERRLPSSLLRSNRTETKPFNGYGEQVASLYDGMNLRKFY